MAELVTFPDVEGALVGYLAPLLGVPVATQVPDSRPGTFVRVVRVGGPRRDLVTDAGMVTVECWAPTTSAAASLCAQTRARVHALEGTHTGTTWVRTVAEVGGPQAYPDPVSGSPRYQFTAQIETRPTP